MRHWDDLPRRKRRDLDDLYWGDPGPWPGGDELFKTQGGIDTVLGPVASLDTALGPADAIAIKLEGPGRHFTDFVAWWTWWEELGRAQVKRGRKRWHGMPGPPGGRRRSRNAPLHRIVLPGEGDDSPDDLPPPDEFARALVRSIWDGPNPPPDGRYTIQIGPIEVGIEVRTEERPRRG